MLSKWFCEEVVLIQLVRMKDEELFGAYLDQVVVSLNHQQYPHEQEVLLVYYLNYEVRNGASVSSWFSGAA